MTSSNLVVRGNSSTPARLDTVTIECSVTARPPINITWIKATDITKLIITSTPQISITHQLTSTPSRPLLRSTLTIRSVEAADNGVYICEANNDPSSPSVSANFTICVIGK